MKLVPGCSGSSHVMSSDDRSSSAQSESSADHEADEVLRGLDCPAVSGPQPEQSPDAEAEPVLPAPDIEAEQEDTVRDAQNKIDLPTSQGTTLQPGSPRPRSCSRSRSPRRFSTE